MNRHFLIASMVFGGMLGVLLGMADIYFPSVKFMVASLIGNGIFAVGYLIYQQKND